MKFLILASALLTQAVPRPAFAARVYRSPSSLFASGEQALEILRKKQSALVELNWIKVQWEEGDQKKEGWIRRSVVVKEPDTMRTAHTRSESMYKDRPDHESPPKGTLPAVAVQVLGHQEDWVQVRWKSKKIWIKEKDLRAETWDKGIVFVRDHVSMHAHPETSSRAVRQIPVATRLIPDERRGNWMKITYKKKTGWVRLDQVISRFDFATHVFADGKERKIVALSGGWAELEDESFKDLKAVRGLRTSRDFVVVAEGLANIRSAPQVSGSAVLQTFGFGQKLKVVEEENILWASSQLPGEDGLLWWLASGEASPSQEITAPTLGTLTTPEIFSRKIFDMASSPQVAKLTFVSAGGVFKTMDGENWEQIKQFGDENYPLAVTPSGVVLVGSYRSDDHGMNFRPYLRWDKLISILLLSSGQQSQSFRLTKIQVQGWGEETLFLTLETPSGSSYVMKTSDWGKTWILASTRKGHRRYLANHGE